MSVEPPTSGESIAHVADTPPESSSASSQDAKTPVDGWWIVMVTMSSEAVAPSRKASAVRRAAAASRPLVGSSRNMHTA